MEQGFDIPRLLVLRKLTKAVSEHFEQQLTGHLSNLAPLLNPRALLGDHIRGTAKGAVKDADKVYQELRKLYQPIATSKPFSLPADLGSPLDIYGAQPAITPSEYHYTAQTGDGGTKEITVTAPLKWVLSYKGLGPRRLRELIATQASGGDAELLGCVLHYLVMHVIGSRETGLRPLLQALRYPLSSGRADEFGSLPLTYVSCAVSTMRPPDDIIVQSTEISGTSSFEEVVNLQDIAELADPLKTRLVEIVAAQDEKLLAEIGA